MASVISSSEYVADVPPTPSEPTPLLPPTHEPSLSNGSGVSDPAPGTDAPPLTNGTTNGTTTNGTPQAPPFPTLAGKVALITGASRGIGAGIALELAARGASIVLNYNTSPAPAAALVSQIHALGTGARALAVQADVTRVAEISRLFETALAHFHHLDIVVSNSGMESFDPLDSITETRFDLVFGLNFRAQFFVAQHAHRHLVAGGRLILMSSIAAGLIGVRDHALYNASKSAINGVTKSFAKDFGDRGITVNAIAPGGVKSDMFADVAWKYIPGADKGWGKERIEDAMAANCPLGRCAEPVDVARVVAFLAGADGGWVNGQIITISGGSGQ